MINRKPWMAIVLALTATLGSGCKSPLRLDKAMPSLSAKKTDGNETSPPLVKPVHVSDEDAPELLPPATDKNEASTPAIDTTELSKEDPSVGDGNPPAFTPVPFDTSLPPSLWDRHPPGEKAIALPALQLSQVTESIYTSFPALQAASLEMEVATGKQVAAWGEFDLKVKADSISQPLGYYKNYRNSLKLEQGLWAGGAAYGQYRVGNGNFPTWYGERETNEGGEFKIGIAQPLLKDRNIDQRRAEILQASLRQQQVEPAVRGQLLAFVNAGADAYWSWVAAGQAYETNRDLLRITIERNKIYEARVKLEDLPEIELIQNERLIASREAKLIESQRKLQQSAIKLSLFLRDDKGDPLLPPPGQLPKGFPPPIKPNLERLESDIAAAYVARPELQELNLMRSQAEIDLASGQNLTLPSLNAALEASKDVGQPTSSKGDKTPFEMEAGLYFEVPVQRRKGQGKIQEAQGKIGQLTAKRRLVENKIMLEVQDAMSALTASYDRWLRAQEGVKLAKQLEAAERARFARQDNDLLRVALQETAALEAKLLEIEAIADYFKAAAAYRAALATDPFEADTDFSKVGPTPEALPAVEPEFIPPMPQAAAE